jgi:hypothetical protein
LLKLNERYFQDEMTGPDDVILDLGGKITESHDQILEYVDILLDPEEDIPELKDVKETITNSGIDLQ